MITREQFSALEASHGIGMVLVLSVGDDEFAFRRPSDIDVEFAMDERTRGIGEWMEHALIGCVLCPEVPTANQADNKTSCPELVAVRERIQAIWKEVPYCRDSVPLALLHSCGLMPHIEQTALGGGRYDLNIVGDVSVGGDVWSFVAHANTLSGPQYERVRKLSLSEGTSGDKFSYTSGVLSFDGIDREEFARRYPFAVLAIGQIVRGLGSSTRAVSVKKFSSGSVPPPGNSTATPAST